MRSTSLNDLTVIHNNGIHSVSVDFCGCRNVPMHVQLLQVGWWPATPLEPHSCATFQVLREFQLLNLQGKLSVYDYYRTLELLTDNVGLQQLPASAILFKRCKFE